MMGQKRIYHLPSPKLEVFRMLVCACVAPARGRGGTRMHYGMKASWRRQCDALGQVLLGKLRSCYSCRTQTHQVHKNNGSSIRQVSPIHGDPSSQYTLAYKDLLLSRTAPSEVMWSPCFNKSEVSRRQNVHNIKQVVIMLWQCRRSAFFLS